MFRLEIPQVMVILTCWMSFQKSRIGNVILSSFWLCPESWVGMSRIGNKGAECLVSGVQERHLRQPDSKCHLYCVSVFVYLCSCICICIWWETTENNVSRVRERHLREPDTKLTSSEWRRGGILSVTGVGGRSPDTRLTTNHRSSFAEIASGMQLTPWSIQLCHRSFGKPLPTNLNAFLWGSTPKVKVYVANVRHVIWKGKWSF